MSATYDATLPSDKDWVRLLIGDTTVPSSILSDEEILAIIDEERAEGKPKKYFAAARAIEIIAVRWSQSGAGLTSKSVEDLSLQFGVSGSAMEIFKTVACNLRKRGSELQAGRRRVFRTVGK